METNEVAILGYFSVESAAVAPPAVGGHGNPRCVVGSGITFQGRLNCRPFVSASRMGPRNRVWVPLLHDLR